MHPSTILAALLPAAAVMAQKNGGMEGGMKGGGKAAKGAVHVVKVGDGGLKFEPNDIKAAVGDKVEFHFYPMAHSVAQSSFDAPCMPMTNGTAKGFFSGPVKVASGVGAEVFTIDVKDTMPKWFYCATGKHCQSGMVGVINAPASGPRTLDAYTKSAAAAKANVAPATTGGGTLGAPSGGSTGGGSPKTGGGGGSSSPSGTMPNPTKPSGPVTAAGIEARGEVRWGLLSMGMAAAGMVGGLLI